MALIASVSGIRGTIGGEPGSNLTPEDIVRFVSAYAQWLQLQQLTRKVVIGRDGRISGPMVQGLVVQTLLAMGFDVVDLGLTTTPTVEMAVTAEGAGGGIILTASHNPAEWNALKLLNERGEFLSANDGEKLLSLVKERSYTYATVDHIGRHFVAGNYLDYHIEQILSLPYVDVDAIKASQFKVVVDAVNSTGAIALPVLLHALQVQYTIINPEVTGRFAHNPEPLPEHLTALCEAVVVEKADMGIAVDPDVDRLAFVAEDGSWFGEEYTLVAAADHILSTNPGSVVSNLSSSRALDDLAKRYNQQRFTSSVGEVHVVQRMRETKAVIGGEGNGGVILPELHYGRDALLGVALVLSMLSKRNISLSQLRKTYPDYAMAKMKAEITSEDQWAEIKDRIRDVYKSFPINEQDGLKVDLPEGWLHIRKSNTEPIIRIYTEMPDSASAIKLAQEVQALIKVAMPLH